MLNLITQKAKENLENKEKTKNLNQEEINRRANIIGYSALCFSMLKANPSDDIKFNIEKALEMSGESGPYVQYTFARINSILNKANFKIKETNLETLNFKLLGQKEQTLIKLLKNYNQIITEACTKYKISSIANYLIKISQTFNDFYQNSKILCSENDSKNIQLVLCFVTKKIIKDGLNLLDIETLDQM